MSASAPPLADPGRPHPGGLPPEIPGGTIAALKGALPRIQAHDVPSLAAGIAFKIFLALFPSLVAAVAVFSLFSDPAAMVERASGVLPRQALDLLDRQLTDVAATPGAGGLLTVGVLGGVWAASSAAATLVKGLNRVYGVDETRNFVKQRLVALAIIFSLLAALLALVGLIVLGPQLQRLLLPEELFGGLGSVVFGLGQAIGAVAILALLFAFVYWRGPNRDIPRWEWITPGSVIGVVSWLVLSGVFTLYAQTAGNYADTYGVLAGAIVMMLWLQLSITAVLVGGAINAEREQLEAQAGHIAEGAGTSLIEPTTEPLIDHGVRPELPAPRHRPPMRRQAAVAGLVAALAGLIAVVRRRG